MNMNMRGKLAALGISLATVIIASIMLQTWSITNGWSAGAFCWVGETLRNVPVMDVDKK